MLPANLVSVYQQYKDDTNAVASWLASTARSCGYPSDLLSGGSPQSTDPEPSKRLKGKARKDAKAAASQPHGSSSSSRRPDYTIAIKDFIPLAEFVAASRKPVVSVPLVFTNTLNRVISARSGFGSRLAELGKSTDVSADSKHSYFVGVLEKVREILNLHVPPTSQDTASPRAHPDPVGEVGGRFAGLSVDEPSEEFLNAPDIERPVPVKDDNATYVAEHRKDFYEVIFAYSLLMRDLAKIRSRIWWIWVTYRDEPFDAASAAIATNTACDLARNLMEDMAPMLKAHGGAQRVGQIFYAYRCLVEGFSFDDCVKSGAELNYDTYNIAFATFMIPYLVLELTVDTLNSGPPNGLPVLSHGSPFTYDPTLDWDRMTKQEKYEQDKILILEFFTDILSLVRAVPVYPVQDEVIRGMQELDRTREVPMYLAFATQIVVDIHHLLRDRVYSAQERCMSDLGLIDEDIALHLDFCAKIGARDPSKSDDKTLEEIREAIKWVQDDPIRQIKFKAQSEDDMYLITPIHRVLRYSPVISGLMLYYFRAFTYKIGLGFVDAGSSIVCPLHLYNALEKEKLLSPQQVLAESWDDMTVAKAILGNDSFYVGSQLPHNRDDYIKKLVLQLGISATAFTKSKNPRIWDERKLTSKNGGRGVKRDCAPVSDMFFDRYVRNTGQVDWTPEHVERVISRSLYEVVEADQKGFVSVDIKDPDRLRERKRNLAAEAAGKRAATATATRIAPNELISTLFLVLGAESVTMVFPYMALQRAAWGVLQAVREACRPLLLQHFSPKQLEDEERLPQVVISILVTLAKGDDRLLIKAGEAVKDQLRRGEGARAMQRLQAMGCHVVLRTPEAGTPSP